MAILVWATLGIAIWHFTVFVPDRFRGGIVGAFLGALLGALVSGIVWQVAQGASVGSTDIFTALAAVPGCLAGLGLVYMLGVRDEERHPPAV
jgi:ABC-type Fe3+ transport system permease subunit